MESVSGVDISMNTLNRKESKMRFLSHQLSRKIRTFLIAAVAAVLVQGFLLAEDFAPKVKPPKNMSNRSYWIKTMSEWKVPSTEEVGAPAYPGAFIVQMNGPTQMESNGTKLTTLPIVILETEDEPAKVAAFYKEKLTGWKYENKFGMFDVFWKGGEDFNFMDIDQAATRVNIIIQEPITSDSDRMMPTSKARIQIVYNPSK
jgi:hypothetical protein